MSLSKALNSGVSAVLSLQSGMDVIGNNLANVNTTGFRASRTTFRDLYYQTLSGASSANGTASTDPTLGGSNPSQIGFGTSLSSVDVLNTRGSWTPTGQDTDCYIDGEGYFVVQDGTGGRMYTRVGSLSFDNSGNLVDGNQRLVMGKNYTVDLTADPPTSTAVSIPGTEDATDKAKQLESIHVPDDPESKTTPAAKIAYKNLSIDSNGVISLELKSGKMVQIGQIALANVPNPSGLTQGGNSYMKNTSGADANITYAAPGGVVGGLKTGGLEGSNVNLANEFANMIVTQRAFQANSKIITVSDEMLETLVNMKR